MSEPGTRGGSERIAQLPTNIVLAGEIEAAEVRFPGDRRKIWGQIVKT
jgi:hypothetical protein